MTYDSLEEFNIDKAILEASNYAWIYKVAQTYV